MWYQKEIIIDAKQRGFHIITSEITENISKIIGYEFDNDDIIKANSICDPNIKALTTVTVFHAGYQITKSYYFFLCVDF